MKCRNVCFVILSLWLAFSMNVSVHAEEIPLEIKLEYLESQEEILVSVIASEPVVLEAFTFSIVFDNDVYKLHKGYDVIPKGYDYTLEFTEHQKGAMMLSNALEDKVIFSGVNDAEDNAAYEGTIAQAALLQYCSSQDEIPPIWLEISAIQLNGEAVAITEENNQISCEAIEDASEPLQEDESDAIEGGSSVVGNTKEPVWKNANSVSENAVSKDAVVTKENDENISTISTLQAISNQAVVEATQEAGDSKTVIKSIKHEQSDYDKNDQKSYKCYGLWICFAVVCMIAGAVVLYIRRKRKRSEGL